MLEKFKRMREELDFLVCSNKQLENSYLNDDEWEQVQSMIVLLEPSVGMGQGHVLGRDSLGQSKSLDKTCNV